MQHFRSPENQASFNSLVEELRTTHPHNERIEEIANEIFALGKNEGVGSAVASQEERLPLPPIGTAPIHSDPPGAHPWG